MNSSYKLGKKIPRDFKNTNNSVVCIKHFPESFFVRKDKITDKTGTVIEIPRVYPKLSENACPCIFPGCPSYLNETIKEGSVTIQRKEKLKQLDEQLFTNFIKKDAITSFDCESCITFLFMNCENCPSILKSLKINTDLSIVIFNNNRELNIPSVGKILNNPPRLTYFSELLNILNKVNVFEEICSINSVPHHVMAIKSWEKYIENCNAENFEAANFILEQMKLLNLNKHGRKYSSNLIVFSFCMYIKSTTCYSYVRDKGNIILPSVRQLQRVASELYIYINVTPGLSTLANENYLRGSCKKLKDHEKQVLQIDEIFIKSAITYKCNKIIGFTEKGEAATTIQCFLHSSLLSKNKEIVSLNPVKNMSAEDLYSMTLEILSLMEKVGFSVVCIVSDNNRVNRNCFSKLCNGTIKSVIQNPANNAKKLHLILDTVHLIKSIRNNWLNQKDADSSLMYPDPSEFSQIQKASFPSLF
ncbi:transposable element P transposase [Trichonephila clavipes]|nr:transposable element P transposase [Trichonephila clavipes]